MVFEAGLTLFHILEEFTFDRVGFLAFLSQIPSYLAYTGKFSLEEHLTAEGLFFV